MRSTETVLTRIAIVADPPIMNQATSVVRQDPNRVHGLLTTFAMPGIERQPWGGGDMKPMQQAFDPRPRFIHMRHPTPPQHLLEMEHGRFERPGGFGKPVRQG